MESHLQVSQKVLISSSVHHFILKGFLHWVFCKPHDWQGGNQSVAKKERWSVTSLQALGQNLHGLTSWFILPTHLSIVKLWERLFHVTIITKKL